MIGCPKPKHVVDQKLIQKVRSYGKCMLEGQGECCGVLDIHHIRSRGSGGGDTEDNVILLCRCHHQLAHMGIIPKKVLYETLAKIYMVWYNRNTARGVKSGL